MKIKKEHFIMARARNIGQKLAEQEFERLSKIASKKDEKKIKIYLDEYGNEVHVKGPLVDRVRKTESLAERIARYDRLSAAVAASRASMVHALGDMFTDEPDEDPNDDTLMDNVEIRDDFGEVINPTPVKEPEIGVQEGEKPAATTSQAGEKPTVEPVSDPETVQE